MYERSYNKTVLRQADIPEPKKGFNWKRFIWITGIVIVLSGIVVLIKLPRLQVQTVRVDGTNVADPDDISQFVMTNLEGRYLRFFPKTSVLLVQTKQLEAKMKQAYPRFKTVTIEHKGSNGLSVTVAEYQGMYLWCVSETECYFMDERGTVFSEAPYFSGSAYLKLYAGSKQTLPFEPISSTDLDIVKKLVDRLNAINIFPTEFHFLSEHELDVTFNHFGTNGLIKFNQTNDIDEALSALFTGIHTAPLSGLYGDRAKILEYIDVRFSNKIVYKFQ